MLIVLDSPKLPHQSIDVPFTPLNCVWMGQFSRHLPLPCWGHHLIIFPLSEHDLLAPSTKLRSTEYLWLHADPASVPLYVQNSSSPEPVHVMILMLSPGFVLDMAEFLNIPANLNNLLQGIPLPKGDLLSDLLEMMVTARLDSAGVNEVFMEIVGHVLQLLRLRYMALVNFSDHKESTSQDLTGRLLQARQFIEAQYGTAIQTADIAQHVALSEYHFARLFKKAFGTTVYQYVRRQRLNGARHLLESTDLPITTIALDVGYASLSAFIQAFGKAFGLTPSHYRDQFANFEN